MALVGHWKLTEDSLFLGTELVTNGNMELDSDWDNQASPAANVRSDEQAHSGIYSRKITLNGIGSFGGISSADEITFVVGKSYIITGWAYNLNMSNGERLVMDCTQFSAGAFSIYPNQGVWAQWSEVVVATETSGKILLYNYPTDIANANASFYIDDVSIKEIYFEDDSGNGNNGTPANPPIFTTNQQGRENRATILTSPNDDINMGQPSELNTGITNFTISGWIKLVALGSAPTNYALFSNNSFNNHGYYLRIGDDNGANWGRIALATSQAAGSTFLLTAIQQYPNDQSWHHIAGVKDGVNFKIYLDYSTTFTGGGALAPVDSITNSTIGRWAAQLFDGGICDVRVFNSALTDSEIKAIYDSELFWHTETITGQMDFAGRLSAQNPKWLLLDKSLNWIGEWDESYSYNINDTVLYKIDDGNEWHIFVSKTNHNVGNVPTTSAAYWRRYYQEQLL